MKRNIYRICLALSCVAFFSSCSREIQTDGPIVLTQKASGEISIGSTYQQVMQDSVRSESQISSAVISVLSETGTTLSTEVVSGADLQQGVVVERFPMVQETLVNYFINGQLVDSTLLDTGASAD